MLKQNSFVIYNVDTLYVYKSVKTAGGAKKSAQAMVNKGKNVAWTDRENYETNIDHMTTTYNMLDPERKPIPIRKSQLGGCCDPATETYHSM